MLADVVQSNFPDGVKLPDCLRAVCDYLDVVVAIPDGEVLEGELPPGKLRLLLAWVEIHRDDLRAGWELAVRGEQPFRIEPLR